MKIAIWNGKKLVAELDVREAPGPDLQLDPWNDKLHVVSAHVRGQVVTYLNGLTPRVNAPEIIRVRQPCVELTCNHTYAEQCGPVCGHIHAGRSRDEAPGPPRRNMYGLCVGCGSPPEAEHGNICTEVGR